MIRAPRDRLRSATGAAGASALASILMATAAAPAAAQQPNAEVCRAVYEDLFVPLSAGEPCQVLALELVGRRTDAFWVPATEDASLEERVSDGDLQPVSSGPASAAGSVAQSEALPSAQPLAVGGGSLSAVGSDAGADAITALTFNPTIFFGGDREAVARNSRLTDLTVFFPVEDLDRDDDGDIDYFGFRLRVNFTAFSAASAVADSARAAFERLLLAESDAAQALLDRLRGMSETRMRACAQVVDSDVGLTAVEETCGLALTAPSPEAYEAFRSHLDRARTVADSRYMGLDLRLDFGDPTLGAVPDADATAINAGVAFGNQFVGAAEDPLAPSTGIRGRAGLRYVDMRDLDERRLAVDGGVGFVMKRPVAIDQALTISFGFEARYGGVEEALEDELQSDFVAMRAGLTVPLTQGTDVAIGWSRRIVGGDEASTLTVTGAWKLLLPETQR